MATTDLISQFLADLNAQLGRASDPISQQVAGSDLQIAGTANATSSALTTDSQLSASGNFSVPSATTAGGTPAPAPTGGANPLTTIAPIGGSIAAPMLISALKKNPSTGAAAAAAAKADTTPVTTAQVAAKVQSSSDQAAAAQTTAAAQKVQLSQNTVVANLSGQNDSLGVIQGNIDNTLKPILGNTYSSVGALNQAADAAQQNFNNVAALAANPTLLNNTIKDAAANNSFDLSVFANKGIDPKTGLVSQAAQDAYIQPKLSDAYNNLTAIQNTQAQVTAAETPLAQSIAKQIGSVDGSGGYTLIDGKYYSNNDLNAVDAGVDPSTLPGYTPDQMISWVSQYKSDVGVQLGLAKAKQVPLNDQVSSDQQAEGLVAKQDQAKIDQAAATDQTATQSAAAAAKTAAAETAKIATANSALQKAGKIDTAIGVVGTGASIFGLFESVASMAKAGKATALAATIGVLSIVGLQYFKNVLVNGILDLSQKAVIAANGTVAYDASSIATTANNALFTTPVNTGDFSASNLILTGKGKFLKFLSSKWGTAAIALAVIAIAVLMGMARTANTAEAPAVKMPTLWIGTAGAMGLLAVTSLAGLSPYGLMNGTSQLTPKPMSAASMTAALSNSGLSTETTDGTFNPVTVDASFDKYSPVYYHTGSATAPDQIMMVQSQNANTDTAVVLTVASNLLRIGPAAPGQAFISMTDSSGNLNSKFYQGIEDGNGYCRGAVGLLSENAVGQCIQSNKLVSN